MTTLNLCPGCFNAPLYNSHRKDWRDACMLFAGKAPVRCGLCDYRSYVPIRRRKPDTPK